MNWSRVTSSAGEEEKGSIVAGVMAGGPKASEIDSFGAEASQQIPRVSLLPITIPINHLTSPSWDIGSVMSIRYSL